MGGGVGRPRCKWAPRTGTMGDCEWMSELVSVMCRWFMHLYDSHLPEWITHNMFISYSNEISEHDIRQYQREDPNTRAKYNNVNIAIARNPHTSCSPSLSPFSPSLYLYLVHCASSVRYHWIALKAKSVGAHTEHTAHTIMVELDVGRSGVNVWKMLEKNKSSPSSHRERTACAFDQHQQQQHPYNRRRYRRTREANRWSKQRRQMFVQLFVGVEHMCCRQHATLATTSSSSSCSSDSQANVQSFNSWIFILVYCWHSTITVVHLVRHTASYPTFVTRDVISKSYRIQKRVRRSSLNQFAEEFVPSWLPIHSRLQTNLPTVELIKALIN